MVKRIAFFYSQEEVLDNTKTLTYIAPIIFLVNDTDNEYTNRNENNSSAYVRCNLADV